MTDKKIPFLGIVEVAERLGKSQKTVRRLIASNELPSTKQGGVYKISTSALKGFLRQEVENEKTGLDEKLTVKSKSPNYKNNGKDDVHWIDIANDWDTTKKSKLNFVDLFSGAGGITKGVKLLIKPTSSMPVIRKPVKKASCF